MLSLFNALYSYLIGGHYYDKVITYFNGAGRIALFGASSQSNRGYVLALMLLM
ncbi:MAG: hypothetical protein ACJAYB_002893 [Psychromonas sp.]|jgi:hypothetical protein